jgi:hypothetical protein
LKIDNALFRGHARVDFTPAHPKDVVNLEFVQQMVMQGAAGAVFITDVTPSSTGIVGGKEYKPNTVPANYVLENCFADTNNIRVHFLAEGPSTFYSPVVTIGAVTAQSMTEVAGDKRLFSGYVDINLAESGAVTLSSNTGSSAVVNVTLLTVGPTVQSVTIGALPGSQTAVKQGDVVPYTAVVQNSATDIVVKNLGAASAESGTQVFGANDSAGAGFKTVSGNFVVANRTGSLQLTVAAANFIGTEGAAVASGNSITLDQTVPTFGAISVAYPNGQTALKDSETADVTVTVNNADVYNYTFTNGTVAGPTSYSATKTVTRTSGNYVTGNNYQIVATRSSNGASATFNGAINIAHVAASAVVSIIGNPARLQSSPAGNDYTVQIAPDQVLAGAPSMDASSGTWIGSWTPSGNNWRRTLRIADSDAKGAQTFSNLSMTNKAGKVSGTITSGASYTVGGLVLRTITFPAFARFTPIGSSVVTIGKTVAKYSGTADNLTLRNDTNQAAASYTIVNSAGNYNATGDHLFLSDLDYANSNTSGTLRVDFSESV